MPAWKVSDEQTASELLTRMGQDTSIYIDSSSSALDGSDAVILAPTAYKGVTMLIAARRRSSTSASASTAVLGQSSYYIQEETIAPQPVDVAVPEETASFEVPAFVEEHSSDSDLIPSVAADTSTSTDYEPTKSSVPPDSTYTVEEEAPEEEFFGPTSWERVESAEAQLEPAPASEIPVRDELDSTSHATPDLTGVPSLPESFTNASYANPNPVTKAPPAATQTPAAPERRYVATGFLGLDETVEDEEDLAREKRPWWKKLFID